jgi:hypothetical protein
MGKALVFREKVESPWNKITEEVLGWYDEYEYMRRMPILYPRWAYINFNAWIRGKVCEQHRIHRCWPSLSFFQRV